MNSKHTKKREKIVQEHIVLKTQSFTRRKTVTLNEMSVHFTGWDACMLRTHASNQCVSSLDATFPIQIIRKQTKCNQIKYEQKVDIVVACFGFLGYFFF